MAKDRSGPFIIAYGGEDHLLDRVLQAAHSWKSRSVIRLDGDGLTDSEFVEVCEHRHFDGGDRVVVLDNAEKLKGVESLKGFIGSKDPQDSSVIIICAIRSEKLPSVWQAAVEKGQTRHCPALKPWETAKLQKLVLAEARRLKMDLGAGVVEVFSYLLGPNLRLITNELQKLFYIVGAGGVVERKHVVSVISPAMPAHPYEVAEATLNRNSKKALNLLSLLYKSKGDGVCIPVVASLLKLVEQIVVVRQMLDSGDAVSLISTRVGMHRYRVEKQLLPAARKHTVLELLAYMKRLCKLDVLVKGSAQSKRTQVELAVLSIAA